MKTQKVFFFQLMQNARNALCNYKLNIFLNSLFILINNYWDTETE